MKLCSQLILVILLGISCGKQLNDLLNMGKRPHKNSITDASFTDQVVEFEKTFKLKVSVPIVFEKLDSNKAGACYKWSDGYREIRINPEYWDTYSVFEREQLVFHELGHCIFNLDHDDSIFTVASIECPNSVMRSYMFSDLEVQNCYVPERTHYMEDLNGKR